MLRKALFLVVFLFSVYPFCVFFEKAEANVITTIAFYSILVLFFIALKKIFSYHVFINSLITVVITLFIIELVLRYVIEYPLTYPEQNDGFYKSQYYAPVRMHSRTDLHTLEPSPFSERHYVSPEFNFPVEELNRYGFRGEEPHVDKKIILALGDSFTEGLGAPADSTYPVLLTNFLKSDDSSLFVFNAGTAGNDPFFDFKMLQKLSSEIEVAKVIFLVNTSDVNDVVSRGGYDRFLEEGKLKYRSPPWWEVLYASSMVFRLFMHNAMDIHYNLMTYEETDRANFEAAGEIYSLFHNRILPWSKEKEIPVVIVLHPFLSEIDQPFKTYTYLDEKLSKLKGVKYYNTRLGMKNHMGNPNDYYWLKDGHFNPRGYSILAKEIYENIFKPDSLLLLKN